MGKKYQVIGIGNAMVDILCYENEEFLNSHSITKGIMQLIDISRAKQLHEIITVSKSESGGSAANTIAGIAKLGGKTAYVGKVKNDPLGILFANDLKKQNVVYNTPFSPEKNIDETGRCTIIVTPDGERSMNTYLGVTEYLKPSDIDEAQIKDTEWIYLEGYRFDGPESHEAFNKAIKACKSADGKVSLTLSDPFCVERHREAFHNMIKSNIDLLFCNEFELKAMYQTNDLNQALKLCSNDVGILACTAAENGAFIINKSEKIHIPAIPTKIVDATGAGDMFAGGFLWGLTEGYDLATCGKMGCIAASEIISHLGARAEKDLKKLFKENEIL